MDRFDPGPQPAGRSPAPGRLGFLQAYANSFWDLARGGGELWPDPAQYGQWLRARGLGDAPPTGAQHAEAIAVREAVRDLARRNHGGEHDPGHPELAILQAAARNAPTYVVPRNAGSELSVAHEPATAGHPGAVALLLGVLAEAIADGSWARIKACPGPHCGWLYHDASRNRSSQWCSMSLCGNRVKGAAFRARRQGVEPARRT